MRERAAATVARATQRPPLKDPTYTVVCDECGFYALCWAPERDGTRLDALLAENQRLRDALERIARGAESNPRYAVAAKAREALAGAGDTPNPDESPFQMPRLETVEKGIRGPWNDKEWENDNG